MEQKSQMPAFVPAASATTFHGHGLRRGVCRGQQSPRIMASPYTRITAALGALIFDCDGVLADTERDAHRVAFNIAFKERGLEVEWDEALYGKLLETGGGKERMTAYWNGEGAWPEGLNGDDAGKQALVKALHARKTALFMELVEAGRVPLRPGVARLVGEARAAGVPVAVCSTSNEKAVQKIVDQLGESASDIAVFAGDVVPKKKPAPDVYLLAAQKLGVDAGNVCVVEDSFIGVSAARAAGMPCLVTKSTYTRQEDFAQAQGVVESLDNPRTTLQDLTEMVEAMGAQPGQQSPPPSRGVRPMRRRFGSRYL